VVAEGIVKALRRQTAMLAEHQIPVTASVGVALFDGLTNNEILAGADLAMYEAKEAGRNRLALYRSPAEGGPQSSSRLAEAERIQRALTHDHLELYSQPILDLTNNVVSQLRVAAPVAHRGRQPAPAERLSVCLPNDSARLSRSTPG
jgi:predicted signal transduction protein with EAL and GGDEF domain